MKRTTTPFTSVGDLGRVISITETTHDVLFVPGAPRRARTEKEQQILELELRQAREKPLGVRRSDGRDTRFVPLVVLDDVVDDVETLVADRVAPDTAQERAHVFRWLVTKTTAKSDRFAHWTVSYKCRASVARRINDRNRRSAPFTSIGESPIS